MIAVETFDDYLIRIEDGYFLGFWPSLSKMPNFVHPILLCNGISDQYFFLELASYYHDAKVSWLGLNNQILRMKLVSKQKLQQSYIV